MAERYVKPNGEILATDFAIERITSPTNKSFLGAVSMLSQSFPPVLLQNAKSFREYFSEEEQMRPDEFFLLVAKDSKESVCGVSVFSYLDRPMESTDPIGSGVIYLEYLMVKPNVRRSGLGSRLFWESLLQIRENGYSPGAIVLEVAKADENLESLEQENVQARLKFFEGLGCRVVGSIDYRMPTIIGNRDLPAYLLIRTLKADFNFDKWFVRSVVYSLIYDVYHYDQQISQKRARDLYESIVGSIDKNNLRLLAPTAVLG